MNENPEIGRVLRANTSGFAVGTRVQQLSIPEFGGLVKVLPNEDEAIIGIIYDIHIDDDPLVGQLILGENLTREAIKDQRQNRMLPVELSALSIGHQTPSGVRQGFPPRPPLNLDPVMMLQDREEIIEFTDKLGYLRLILRSAENGIPVDQLLVAHIRSIYKLRGNDQAWATQVITEVIELLRSNYETLIPTLEAFSEALPELPFP